MHTYGRPRLAIYTYIAHACTVTLHYNPIYSFYLHHTVGCEDPSLLLNGLGMLSSSVFSKAPGSLIVFSCNEGLLPREPITAICEDNGAWTPDPAQIVCHLPQLLRNG